MWALASVFPAYICLDFVSKQDRTSKSNTNTLRQELPSPASSLLIYASRSAHVDGLTPAATGVTVVSEPVYPRPRFLIPLSFDHRFVIPVGGLISILHPCGVGERSRKSFLWLNRVS